MQDRKKGYCYFVKFLIYSVAYCKKKKRKKRIRIKNKRKKRKRKKKNEKEKEVSEPLLPKKVIHGTQWIFTVHSFPRL